MRFTIDPELQLFAESVRRALAGWEAPREPTFGEWWDERDDALAARLAATGWVELAAGPELLGPTVVGAIELGRAVAPICLVDEATLGWPLAVDGRVRHGSGPEQAVALGRERLHHFLIRDARPEPTVDGSGTVRATLTGAASSDDRAPLHAWSAATLGYVAGLAAGALDGGVDHARSREQFGAPLGALPAVQARLADARLLSDGIELLAWQAAAPEEGDPPLRSEALLWSVGAVREVTASMHQV